VKNQWNSGEIGLQKNKKNKMRGSAETGEKVMSKREITLKRLSKESAEEMCWLKCKGDLQSQSKRATHSDSQGVS